MSDAVYIEAFGGNGNGTADNSAALTAAIASGKPVRFGPNTYLLNGPFTISTSAVLIGSPGQTVILGGTQTASTAWITVSASSIFTDGIIFNADTTTTGVNGFSVASSCTYSDWNRCSFLNAGGTNGIGLYFETTSNTNTSTTNIQHVFTDCQAADNGQHGIAGGEIAGIQIVNSRFYNNPACGIRFASGNSSSPVQFCQFIGNQCWYNGIGISLGDYNYITGLA